MASRSRDNIAGMMADGVKCSGAGIGGLTLAGIRVHLLAQSPKYLLIRK